LPGHVSKVAEKYSSIFVDVLIVAATCLFLWR